MVAFAFAADALTLSNRYRSPRNPERPIRKSTRLVVLHTTEAHARSSLNKLSERGEAHYCVVENGTVYRIVDREREAFHAGRSMWNGKEDCDSYSVGIEVVGWHDKPVTLQQIDALKDLVDNLKKIYNLTDAQVVCHSHVAYGAPNKWQKRNHRGRKRCGMLFAMPSVRAKLNLKSKPALDPDVKAGRLIQADTYLGQVLYGSIDTMVGKIGRPAAAPAPAKKGGFLERITSIKSFFTKGDLKNPAPPPEPKQPEVKPVESTKQSTPKTTAVRPPTMKTPASPQPGTRPVITKGPLVRPAQTKQPEETPAKPAFVRGPLKGVPVQQAEAQPVAQTNTLPAAPPSAPQVVPQGDPARDLAMLKSLPGYVQGGPTSATLTPFKIAGKLWKSPETYYYSKGKIIRGDRIDEKKIDSGTLIFYKQ